MDVVHISFDPLALIFDARPIWAALNNAVQGGRVSPTTNDSVQTKFGPVAIHIGIKHQLTAESMRLVRDAQLATCELLSASDIPLWHGYRVARGDAWDRARDGLLLAIDSFLFEFRSFLDLLANFVYGMLKTSDRYPLVM